MGLAKCGYFRGVVNIEGWSLCGVPLCLYTSVFFYSFRKCNSMTKSNLVKMVKAAYSI